MTVPLPAAVVALTAALVLALGGCGIGQPTSPTAESSEPSVTAPVDGVPTSAPTPIRTAVASAPPTVASKPTPTAVTAPRAPATKAKPAGGAVAGLVAVTGVVDGDTIKVRLGGIAERVRIIGIDTPELKARECYAQKAASRMQSLVQSKQVRLVADETQDDRDRYGRLLRHVRLADGRSVAQLMIAGGYGREYTYDAAYQGQGAHRAAQDAARAAHLGIWSNVCTAPAPPQAASPAAPKPSAGDCTIKGNISSKGEKIYHVPGQRHYDATKISPSKGERWFCTESEAVAAGWRPAKV